ncbi:MAG: hypothetical protein GY771_10065 [bacterium]|nr:hypothetical protein [bacterium]
MKQRTNIVSIPVLKCVAISSAEKAKTTNNKTNSHIFKGNPEFTYFLIIAIIRAKKIRPETELAIHAVANGNPGNNNLTGRTMIRNNIEVRP